MKVKIISGFVFLFSASLLCADVASVMISPADLNSTTMPATDDTDSHSYCWSINIPKGFVLDFGCCSIINNEVKEHVGGGQSQGDDQPSWFGLQTEIESDYLILKMVKIYGDTENSRQTAVVTTKTKIPENTEFKYEYLSRYRPVTDNQYSSLWLGTFSRNNKPIKQVVFCARLASIGDDLKNFSPGEPGVPVLGSIGVPPLVLSVNRKIVSSSYWGDAVNGVKARLYSTGPYFLYPGKPNIHIEIKNNMEQEVKIKYPPEYTKDFSPPWQGLGKVEILTADGKLITPMFSSGVPYITPIHKQTSYEGPAELEMYGFNQSIPGRGKYMVRLTIEVQPAEQGKTFKVSTNWLEFDAVLTSHYPNSPYTAQEAFDEARAYLHVLSGHNLTTKQEVIDKFLDVAKKYPDTQYELKSYFCAANMLANDQKNTPAHIVFEQSRVIWGRIISKWPDLVLHETLVARHNLAATDEKQFEKLLEFYKWLLAITTEQKKASIEKWPDYYKNINTFSEKLKSLDRNISSNINTLEHNLIDYRKADELIRIIQEVPSTHLAELAKKELDKRKDNIQK